MLAVKGSDPDLIVRGFRRIAGEIPRMRLKRAIDDDGEPIGYNLVSQLKRLSPDQQAVFEKLPEVFHFKDVKQAMGKEGKQVPNTTIKAFEAAGLCIKIRRGYLSEGAGHHGGTTKGPAPTCYSHCSMGAVRAGGSD
jgi:hypothetical protein